jgi:ADP-ribose pyrophosphatase YjhB (NUDIX family)
MAQVYAIVHDGTNCLVFKKKEHGYFFDGKAVVPIVLNGAGAYCFPGGRLKEGEKPTHGAIRELKEETGVDITKYEFTTVPTCIKMTDGANTYYGVFYFMEADFDEVVKKCQTNLDKANAKAKYLKENKIISGVVVGDTGSIIDNELSKKLKIMSLNDTITDGETFLKGNKNTGWFYNLVNEAIANYGL